MSDNISLWNYVDVSSRLRTIKYTDNKIEPKDFEALFIYQLQNRLYQIKMGKKWDKPQTKTETRSPRLPDVICGTLLAALKLEYKILANSKLPVEGMLRYQDVAYFFKKHHKVLVQFFPTLPYYRMPSTESIGSYCRSVDPQSFGDSFMLWTKDVSKCIPLIKPCSKEVIDFGLSTPKEVIWIVCQWRKQNPLLTEIVRQYFSVSPKVIDKSPVSDLF
ncbi:hypothetical protein JYQ62_17445 [Nostoc sp. UHCC 0702]|nr:hypothetical protein JYQ62_17445 [Nostoc sp. UHCC 0702]